MAVAAAVVVIFARAATAPESDEPAGVPQTPELEPAAPGVAEAASLTADGVEILPPPGDGDLRAFVGDEVLGSDVVVHSVARGGGFWLGTGPSERVLAVAAGEAGVGRLERGALATLRGTMAPADEAVLGLVDGDDRELLERQGAYVDVAELAVDPAG